MSKVRVHITQDDIDEGLPRTSWGCAFNLAVQRLFPDFAISVIPQGDGHTVLVYREEGTIQPDRVLVKRFIVSGNASHWLHNYDRTGVAHPASFEMTEVPRC